MYTRVKSSFPKRVKRHSKKNVSNVNSKYVDWVLEKSSSYVYIRIYLHIYEELFPKTRSLNLSLKIETFFIFYLFFNGVLRVWKRAHHVYIYIYIHTHNI